MDHDLDYEHNLAMMSICIEQYNEFMEGGSEINVREILGLLLDTIMRLNRDDLFRDDFQNSPVSILLFNLKLS